MLGKWTAAVFGTIEEVDGDSCFMTCGFRAKEKRVARVKPANPAAIVSMEGDIPAIASIQNGMKIEYAKGSIKSFDYADDERELVGL